MIHIRLAPEVRQQLKVAATLAGLSMTELTGRLIVQYLEGIKKEAA